MIPFFQSNSLDDKYITKSDDIENFFNASLEENRIFQVTIPGLKSNSVSKIIAIDKNSQVIKFRDTSYSLNELSESVGGFSVTAEVRAEDKIMRFESTLLKDHQHEDQFVLDFPREIEKNVKRQAPRFKPREKIFIPISFQTKKKWHKIGALTDISTKGIGIIIAEDFWSDINKDLVTNFSMNVENTLEFGCAIEVVHTFTVLKTGTKHAGAKFIKLDKAKQQALHETIKQMQALKIISIN